MIVVSEMTDDDIQTYLVDFFTKHDIHFKFVTDYSDEDEAYMVIVCEEDIQREPLLYKSDIPNNYLINFGKQMCKKHMEELRKLDPEIVNFYKKETFISRGSCFICKEKERKK